jgi:hypothetical protein
LQKGEDIFPGLLGLGFEGVWEIAVGCEAWSAGEKKGAAWCGFDGVAVFADLRGDADVVDFVGHDFVPYRETKSLPQGLKPLRKVRLRRD